MKRKRPNRLGTDSELFRYHSRNLHFVCLTCRKMFNQPPSFRRFDSQKRTVQANCPECGAEMINAGRNFKPPRRNNIKQWRKVELLLQGGYKWDYTVEPREITEGLPEGAVRGWCTNRIFSDPRAKTLREAKEDYPPRG